MMQVTVDAQKNKGGMSSVHGNLFKLDPVMQQYLEVSLLAATSSAYAIVHGCSCLHCQMQCTHILADAA